MQIVFAALLWLGLAASTLAEVLQRYPYRSIRLIVPAAPGGVLDLNARRVSEKLSQALGQAVVVDNRPGASGTNAMKVAARAPPDGYTLLLGSLANLCIIPRLLPTASYDPRRDFVPITMGTYGAPILLVNPNNPSRTFAEFVTYARANSGKAAFGSPGIGSTQHLAMEMLQQQTGVEFMHVPYKDSNAQVLNDLVAGHITAAIDFSSVASAYVKSGRLRALVVASATRNPMIADVPSNSEVGLPDFNVSGWHGYFAPTGTSPEILRTLEKGLTAAVSSPDYILWARTLGNESGGGNSQEFSAFVQGECDKWQRVIKHAHIAVE